MDDIQIVEDALKKNASGLTARQIASVTGLNKSHVNSLLYANNQFLKDDSYVPVWKIVGNTAYATKVIDPVLAKFNNIEGAKTFSLDYFKQQYVRVISFGHSESQTVFSSKSGNFICCDSSYEMMMLQYLEDNDLILACGGQNLEIKYQSAAGRTLSYFPDLIVLTRDYHIGIIEIKTATSMDYHINVDKYKALKEFCLKNGFIYMMVDPKNNFLTYDDLLDYKVDDDLIAVCVEIDRRYPNEAAFLLDDDRCNRIYEEWLGKRMLKKEFKLQMHAMVLKLSWYNVYKNGFMIYNRPVILEKTE